jgi:hypothetical protein
MSDNTMELVRGLRDLAKIGIVNARQDKELLNQAADRMEELAWYKINLLPLPSQNDHVMLKNYATLLQGFFGQAVKIQELEAENKRLNLFIAQYMTRKTDDYDEKSTSGLLEE